MKIKERSSTIMGQYIKAVLDDQDLNKNNKEEYYKQFGIEANTCIYCGSKSANTLDHIFSVINDSQFTGYDNSRKNLIPCCQMCNSSKGKKTIYEWLDCENPTKHAKAVLNTPGYQERRKLIDSYIAKNKSNIKEIDDETLKKMNERAREFKKIAIDYLNKLDEQMLKDKQYFANIRKK